MRHRKHTFKVGRTTSHRNAMLANAVCSLIQHGRIKTTLVKAKEIRRHAERMVSYAKVGTLHTRRLAIAALHQVDTVAKLFSTIVPQFKERVGGYTRIIKMGPRRGDAAEMCILEFVESDEVVAATKAAETAAVEDAKADDAPKADEAPKAEEAPKADN